MSALKMAATTLWTQLQQALLQDGLITSHIVTTGPATAKVIVDVCNALEPAWLNMGIKPAEEGKWVLARDEGNNYCALRYYPKTARWMDHSGRTYTDEAFVQWRHL